MATRRPHRRFSPGTAVGGALVGFDQQVFRTTPPSEELVHKGDRLPAVPADDGGTLTIQLPDDPHPAEDRTSR